MHQSMETFTESRTVTFARMVSVRRWKPVQLMVMIQEMVTAVKRTEILGTKDQILS